MALNLPKKIRSGDTLKFSDSVANYPAPTWTLTYTLANESGSHSFSSTADGSNHSFTVAATTTENWKAGQYQFQATISDGSDRFSVSSGVIEILPDFFKDNKAELNHVQKTLANVEATIEALSSKEHSSMQFNGRTVTARDLAELITLRNQYKAELKNIQRAERIANGQASGRKIMVRFK